MGDVLRPPRLLPGIARRWPSAHITWVTAPESVPLLEKHPDIDRVVGFQAGAVPLEVLSERYDVRAVSRALIQALVARAEALRPPPTDAR